MNGRKPVSWKSRDFCVRRANVSAGSQSAAHFVDDDDVDGGADDNDGDGDDDNNDDDDDEGANV